MIAKNKLLTIILVIIVSLMAFAIVDEIIEIVNNNIKSKKMPPKLTAGDIKVIEDFANFKFPVSTKTIKTYWYAWDSEKLYIYFEFDRKDINRFMETLGWKEGDFESYKGELHWQKIKDPTEVNVPLTISKISSNILRSDEDLKWWKFDKERIDWGFQIYNASLKNISITLDQFMLLESADETIRAFVSLKWDAFSGSEEYVEKIRKTMPFGYKERQRESESYPMLKGKSNEE